jgi:ribosomal protein L11 methyltransferase
MMIKYILSNDFENKDVLDMGCGTSVLSILAEKRGAKKITAIDIDSWCYENSLDNILQNSCKNITVMKGDVTSLVDKKFDIILANINRNILLSDINKYYTCLNTNGLLFLSGFYKNDIPMIQEVCVDYNLSLEVQISKNDWVALKFKIK